MLSADLAARYITPYYVTARGFLSWPAARMVRAKIRPWEQRSAVADFIITLRVTLGRRLVSASVEITRFWQVCTSVLNSKNYLFSKFLFSVAML